MRLQTVAGPFTENEAKSTRDYLGEQNHSAYYNADGQWFVEVDLDIVPNRIFGMSWDKIQSIQQKR